MSKETDMKQCLRCGFLSGGFVDDRPCLEIGSGKHRYKAFTASDLASAFGATGGRPPKYKTDEERQKARQDSYDRSNEKKRLAKQKATGSPEAS
jgi:hypothetical protein